ncbi:MAG TPA: heavy metal translocating P-type ATPase [Acidobacteria bacterium]|nr:heavy metal translocating P-type ATPase [Acidobacteriota bacterium]
MSLPRSLPEDGRGLTRLAAAATVAGLVVGAGAWLLGRAGVAHAAWGATIAIVLLPLLFEVVASLRRGEVGVDVIALFAMAGSLALGEYLAGAVIALMLSGGEMLEIYAAGRARKELSALLERAPRVVHRYEDHHLAEPALEEVRPGDRLLVKPGEIVPVDGLLEEGSQEGATAVLDESALTGESVPVERHAGERVRSGVVNAGGPFDLRAVTSAAESTYAAILRLVREAETSRAPFVRLADRYALVFLPVTLVVAGLAWALSGDPVRALAVLVVATPCPLILAAPVAFVSGISRAARRGVIVKGGAAIEALARAKILLLDKTGTLTSGVPKVTRIEAFAEVSAEEILRHAAALDQVSPHVLAASIVAAAHQRGLRLPFPSDVQERLGQGIEGTVGGRRVTLGKADWIAGGAPLPPAAAALRWETAERGLSNVFVGLDGVLAGALVLEDHLRDESAATLKALRRLGIGRIVMLTGDHRPVAEQVGRAVGTDAVEAECSPAGKVEAVRRERRAGPVVMVGDGINDAPALAAADVGVAMGARGATASSEAADVVILQDRLDRLTDAFAIARRARAIALQSVLAGMGLSVAAMIVAAAGFLPPLSGALFQEAIDVAVILNALRALGGGRSEADRPAP